MPGGEPRAPYSDNGKPACEAAWSAKAYTSISWYFSLSCLDWRSDWPQLCIICFARNRVHCEIRATILQVVGQLLRRILRLKVELSVFKAWLVIYPFPGVTGRSPKLQSKLNRILGLRSWKTNWKVPAIHTWSSYGVNRKLIFLFSLDGLLKPKQLTDLRALGSNQKAFPAEEVPATLDFYGHYAIVQLPNLALGRTC